MHKQIQFNRESIKEYIMRQKILRSILKLLNWKASRYTQSHYVDNS